MKELKIFFISSEIYPFAKTGGLADVSAALPKALKELGHEVRVIMPKYRFINERKYVLREVIRLKDIEVPLGKEKKTVNIKSAFIPDSKVQVYFVDSKEYFNRNSLYIDQKTRKEFVDNPDRFIVFSRAVLETLKRLLWSPDIIHCNDWQASLALYYLKNEYKDEPLLKNTAGILSIHNISYQGNYDKSYVEKANIDPALFYSGSDIEYYDKFSFLKTGISYADVITTVSKTYAKEIQNSAEYGCGFEGILKERKQKLFGILNGIDYSVWDPETDEFIYENYSKKAFSKKKKNKQGLLEEAGLEYNENIPLIGIISRLVEQKGFDLIEKIKDKLTELDAQYIFLGTGEEKYQKLLKELKKKYPDKFAIYLKFDEELAHKIEAGSDIFLMPSKYEPCGLNQMISLRYGTVPIVRSVGGLADTIKEYNPQKNEGNGFTFKEYSSNALLRAIKKALKSYKNEKEWAKLVKKGMRKDFSWEKSAKNYVNIYEKAIKIHNKK